MSKKIFVAKAITLLGEVIGVATGVLLMLLLHVSVFLCALMALAMAAAFWVIAYFISRCPDCHMPLHSKSGICLFEHCPHCGRRL